MYVHLIHGNQPYNLVEIIVQAKYREEKYVSQNH